MRLSRAFVTDAAVPGEQDGQSVSLVIVYHVPTHHLLWCVGSSLPCLIAHSPTTMLSPKPGLLPHQARQRWWLYDRWCESSRGKPQHPADLSLNIADMAEAAQLLLGSHDFSTFMDTKRPAGES